VNDDWLVFGLSDQNDKSGKIYGDGLYSTRRDGERIRELIKRQFDSMFPEHGNVALEPNNQMLGIGAPGTNEIVIGEDHYDTNYTEYEHTTLRVMDVATGAIRSMFKDKPAPPAPVSAWLLDAKGQARVAVTRQKGESIVYWVDPRTGAWRKLAQFPSLHATFTPEYVDERDQLFVTVVNPATSLSELRRFDFVTGQPEPAAIVALPGFDTDPSPIRDHGDNKVHGLRLLTDARSVAWFSPAMTTLQAKVDHLLPGRVNLVSCHPCSAPKVISILSYSDTSPGEFLLYRPIEGKFERIGPVRANHPEKRMANLELFRTRTRDGADLPVWITRTEGAPPGPRPAVVLVHGGPWVRGGTWHWNPETQFLASRGYIVIEPEFRGSTGFGDAHFRAGWKQWGQRMQDDVTDALKFAVDKGWVDGKRVCIAGASYGGYATLMGLAKDPGQYKCGIAWAAVTDPRLLFNVYWSDISAVSKTYAMPQLVGDLTQDDAMLTANSPLEQAGRIKAPVLLAYGAKDRRVPLVHGEKMRDALTRFGNPPEWIVYDNEGHGWQNTDNTLDFWRRVDAFLARHLK